MRKFMHLITSKLYFCSNDVMLRKPPWSLEDVIVMLDK